MAIDSCIGGIGCVLVMLVAVRRVSQRREQQYRELIDRWERENLDAWIEQRSNEGSVRYVDRDSRCELQLVHEHGIGLSLIRKGNKS